MLFMQVSSRTEYYTTAKNLLTGGADAMERLMTAYKVERPTHTRRTHTDLTDTENISL